MKNASHIIFDTAKAVNANVEDEENNGPQHAIDLGTEQAFYVPVEGDSSEPELECCLNEPLVDEEIKILEIAFKKGKLRKTKFSVDYVDSQDERHHIGTYESGGESNNYEKFVFPDKVKDIKAIIIKFKGNNDKWPYFAIKGIRLARFIEKTL